MPRTKNTPETITLWKAFWGMNGPEAYSAEAVPIEHPYRPQYRLIKTHWLFGYHRTVDGAHVSLSREAALEVLKQRLEKSLVESRATTSRLRRGIKQINELLAPPASSETASSVPVSPDVVLCVVCNNPLTETGTALDNGPCHIGCYHKAKGKRAESRKPESKKP